MPPTNEELQKQLAEMGTKAKDIQTGLTAVEKPTASTTDFTTELQKKIMGDLDIISSEPTELEKSITESITGLKEARATTEAGIKAKYERERIGAREAGGISLTGAEESRRGFATSTAYLAQLEGQTQKELKDLDLREQEALASGRMELAEKIGNLKIQALTFQQTARQNTFTNFLQLGQYALQQQQEKRLEKQVSQQVIGNLIGKYPDAGIGFDDDFNEAVKKIRGSETYKTDTKQNELDLLKTSAEIEKLKAEAKKAGVGVPSLTAATQNKYAIAGVPNNIALHIQNNLNAGASLEDIRSGLTADLGNKEIAYNYVDRFMEVAQKGQEDSFLNLLLGNLSPEQIQSMLGR